MCGQTEPVVTSSFSANFFCWVCSKTICFSFGFHSRGLCHGYWWWLWWYPSPQGKSRAGSCSHFNQALPNLS